MAEFFDVSLRLVVEETKLPAELYDITVAGPEAKAAELRAQFLLALKTAFGITAQTNSRPAEVYALTVATQGVASEGRSS